jgi:hypothetical protein
MTETVHCFKEIKEFKEMKGVKEIKGLWGLFLTGVGLFDIIRWGCSLFTIN